MVICSYSDWKWIHLSFCQAWCAVSQGADMGKVSDGSHRSNFFEFGHLIINGAVFPLLPPGTTLRVLPVRSFIPSVCHFGVQLFPQQHIIAPPFYLLLAAYPPGLVADAHLTSPLGSVLLFNRRIRISPLSCIHICKFQGVSSVAVGAIHC